MNSIETTVEELSQGQSIPQLPDKDAIVLKARQAYHFLPAPLTVEVEGGAVHLHFPEPSPSNRVQAERLASRAARHARNGRCRKAVRLWHKATELDPARIEYWRDLGMASTELGQIDAAQHYLGIALLLDPNEALTLVALTRIALEINCDFEAAERYARRAVAAAPEDPWALNSLGAVLARTGRMEQAVSIFTLTVQIQPEFAPPYLSLAHLHFARGQLQECLGWLEQLFTHARLQDIRCQSIFDRAQQLRQWVERELACLN